jgi:uroporphyrinogen decarboxylase
MFERRDHDRVPRSDFYWPETIARWQSEGLSGDEQTVFDLVGNDFLRICRIALEPFPGRYEVISEDAETQTVKDGWGGIVKVWKNKYHPPGHIRFGCDSYEVWVNDFKPSLLGAGLQLDLDEVKRTYIAGRKAGLWCCLAGLETFEVTRRFMGDEITLCAMVTDPVWIRDVSRTYTDQLLWHFETILDLGIEPDGVWLVGDMAYSRGPLCSPAMYRELIWPDHRRVADWAHARGMRLIYHTDGDARKTIDLFIEAGFDCLQPLEAKANMDVRELCPKYGNKLAFFGNIDAMVLRSNNQEKIEQEVVSKLAAGMATRGYAYHSDHSVPPEVSWESYRFVIDLLDRYGVYP